MFRVRGELVAEGSPLEADTTLEMARSILGPERWSGFVEQRSADLSRTLAGVRCRINVFQTLPGVSLAVRLLSSFRSSLRDCNLHSDLGAMTQSANGLIVISGPTGSGKSTTLAALIEEINASERRHILTIEDPIEYFFESRRSFVRQREVKTHTPSFEQGVLDAMREDPDVLVIGEMRTPEVMRLTLNAAETGHLVLVTMHSARASEALSRIEMSFAPESQSSIRAQLADCLVGVVCQRLEFLPDHGIRVPHCEILTASPQVRALVRSGQISKLESAIQTGRQDGMWTFERYGRWIEERESWVSPADAARSAPTPEESPTSLPAPAPRPGAVAAQSPDEPAGAPSRTPRDRIVIEEVETDLDALVDALAPSDRPDPSTS